MSLRVGVDLGGTFTDVALLDDARGWLHLFKLPTAPAFGLSGGWPGSPCARRS